MGIKKGERKFVYPLILATPIIMTIVFILNDKAGENGGILKWGILGIIWIIAIGMIIWGEVEIRRKKRKK